MKAKIAVSIATVLLAAVIGCQASPPILSGGSHTLTWTAPVPSNNVSGYNLYAKPPGVADVSSNYVTVAYVPGVIPPTAYPIPASVTTGSTMVVTATNTVPPGAESIASNEFTNNFPASPGAIIGQ